MAGIKEKLRLFNKVRDWEQFHTPENLAKSISIEAAELLECFQWNNEYNIHTVSDEVADIVMYCIIFADKVNIDLKKEILRKLALMANLNYRILIWVCNTIIIIIAKSTNQTLMNYGNI
nr:nucleotide pyrophosphohydrolase [uncultured Aminipila sp.]